MSDFWRQSNKKRTVARTQIQVVVIPRYPIYLLYGVEEEIPVCCVVDGGGNVLFLLSMWNIFFTLILIYLYMDRLVFFALILLNV